MNKETKTANGTILFTENQVTASPAIHDKYYRDEKFELRIKRSKAVEVQIGNSVFHLTVEAANALRHQLFDSVPA